MRFKVYAGNMYCGTLLISFRGVNLFRNREKELEGSITTSGVNKKVKGYAKLTLQRIS